MFCLIHTRIASALSPRISRHTATQHQLFLTITHHSYTAAYRLLCQVTMSVSGCRLLVPATVHWCCELSENNNI